MSRPVLHKMASGQDTTSLGEITTYFYFRANLHTPMRQSENLEEVSNVSPAVAPSSARWSKQFSRSFFFGPGARAPGPKKKEWATSSNPSLTPQPYPAKLH